MKIRSLALALSLLLAGAAVASAAPPPIAGRTVLWSVQLDADRLRAALGQELPASFGLALKSLSGDSITEVGGKLGAVGFYGLQPQKSDETDFPFVAEVGFSPENGGLSPRFEAIAKKRGVAIEDLGGYPSLHFEHAGRRVWVVKLSEVKALVSASRDLLTAILPTAASGLGVALAPNQILSGNVEIALLQAQERWLGNSELLKLLQHLDFQLDAQGEQLTLSAVADLDGERSARRGALMIEGMVAALSMHDKSGIHWDDRLDLKQDGARLTLKLRLEAKELKMLVHQVTPQAGAHTSGDDKAGNDGH